VVLLNHSRGEVCVPGKVHFVAICGTGMAPLALLFKEAGAAVTGSDLYAYPPMGDLLEAGGIRVRIGYDAAHIDADVSAAVVGNAVRKDNPEVQEIARRGIPYFSFPQALSRFFLRGRLPLVVVGTHGKTTSSALLAWVLEECSHKPGFLIGGIPVNFGRNSSVGHGRYFVVEGDEYDSAFFDKQPKFLHYTPHAALFTSLEYDHADIYPTYESLKEQFVRFVGSMPRESLLVVCADYPDALEVARSASCRVETYGFAREADWKALLVDVGEDGVRADLCFRGERVATLSSPLAGRHNLQNVAGVAALCSGVGLSMGAVSAAVQGFKGVVKRQEVVGEAAGVVVVSDFAHHPTAVRETIRAVKSRYRGRRLIAIFEPRTNTSRRKIFQEEFAASFDEADISICSEPYNSDAIPLEERFSAREWVQGMSRRGKEAYWFPTPEAILRHVLEICRGGDVVLIMSSGYFGGLAARLLSELSSRAGQGRGHDGAPAGSRASRCARSDLPERSDDDPDP